MEIGLIAKVVAFVIAIGATFFVFKHYGGLREEKGRQRGISEASEVNDENYTDIIDDVLDGGHPFGVRGSSIAEIASPGADTPDRMASDIHRNGGEGGSNGDSATTS